MMNTHVQTGETTLNTKMRLNNSVESFLLLGQGPVEQSSTNKPLAMRVVGNALAYRKNLL